MQRCPPSPLLFNTVLEVIPSRESRQKTYRSKEKVKQSLFANGMAVYVENPKESTKNFLAHMGEFIKDWLDYEFPGSSRQPTFSLPIY